MSFTHVAFLTNHYSCGTKVREFVFITINRRDSNKIEINCINRLEEEFSFLYYLLVALLC